MDPYPPAPGHWLGWTLKPGTRGNCIEVETHSIYLFTGGVAPEGLLINRLSLSSTALALPAGQQNALLRSGDENAQRNLQKMDTGGPAKKRIP